MSFILLALQSTRQETVIKTAVVYNSTITWTVAVLVLAWIIWNVVQFYRRRNAKRRNPKQSKDSNLKKVVAVKDELSSIWLRKGTSKKIHAIGIGKLPNGEPCVQIFINDSSSQMFDNPPSDSIPNSYKNIPLVLVAMPQASFLSSNEFFADFSKEDYYKLIREKQDVIMGGISAANTNLNGECGTIGYFCKKKSLIPRKDVYLLSNSHVFADLRKAKVDANDLIMQPSPGEKASKRPIGELTYFSHPKLENDTNDANFIDAAIAKFWTNKEPHKTLLPMIGSVSGFVDKNDIEVGEISKKFGRTTGFTSGKVFSIYLDIWVKYDRTGESSFFKNQFLMEPNPQKYPKFVDKGDSGSLVVDGENYASGLIFAGANGDVEIKETPNETEAKIIKTVKNYGVANPISEVLKKLNIELL
jgi:hypothetical protein